MLSYDQISTDQKWLISNKNTLYKVGIGKRPLAIPFDMPLSPEL